MESAIAMGARVTRFRSRFRHLLCMARIVSDMTDLGTTIRANLLRSPRRVVVTDDQRSWNGLTLWLLALNGFDSISLNSSIYLFMSSFVFGYFSLVFLIKFLERFSFMWFGLYCILISFIL